jgi:hypothetical protein
MQWAKLKILQEKSFGFGILNFIINQIKILRK